MPPKLPTSLKLLRGTYRASRAPKNEPKPAAENLPAPDHLTGDARAEWERIAPELAKVGLLTRIDQTALALYCEFYADWRDASKRCATDADGRERKVISQRSGNIVENPYYAIKRRSAEMMHKFLTAFGMTPVARSNIEAAPADKKQTNAFAKLG